MKNKILIFAFSLLLNLNCFGTKIVNATSFDKYVYIKGKSIELSANGECSLDEFICEEDEYLEIALTPGRDVYEIRFAFSSPSYKFEKKSIKKSSLFYITEKMVPYPKVTLKNQLKVYCNLFESVDELKKFLESEKKD